MQRALLTPSKFLSNVPRPSLEGAEEESPKRVASEAKAPQGAVFFWLLFFCARKKKVTRREAKTCPEGKKVRAAWPIKTFLS